MSLEVEDQERKEAESDEARRLEFRSGLGDSFIVAVQFLTRLPLGSNRAVSSNSLRRSLIFFPLVGAGIGLVTALIVRVAGVFWPAWLAVVIALAIELRLTGALHEDGVADFCDAFGGGWTRDEVLAILKDSRIGTYGALGLLIGFSLRCLATIAIVYKHGTSNPLMWAVTIVASAMIGRLAICLAMFFIRPVPQRSSLARDIGRQLTVRDLLMATLLVSPLLVWFAYLQPYTCLAAGVLLIPIISWILVRVNRRLGGITGDCLGFVCYVAQILVLLAGAIKDEFWSTFT